ncbi:TPA: phage tail sheath subtilisin-like domain-containing protein [Escherichia coli]
MADAFLNANRVAELWCIPQGNGTGNAAVGEISLSGTAGENGSLVTYIAGQRLAVSVAAGATGAALADLLVARIKGQPDLPVTAEVRADSGDDDTHADVVLSAKFTGALSAVDVRWNYYAGETTPYGIITAFKAASGKNGNPDISASIAGMGDLQYKYIVMPYTDEANLNLLRTELQERWGPVNQADGFAVTVLSGTYGDISTFGVSRNDHLISCIGNKLAGSAIGRVVTKGAGALGWMGKGAGRALSRLGGPVMGALQLAPVLMDEQASTHEKAGAIGSTAGAWLGGAVGSLAGPLGTVAGATLGSVAGEYLGGFVTDLYQKWTATDKEPQEQKVNAEASLRVELGEGLRLTSSRVTEDGMGLNIYAGDNYITGW